MLRQLTIDANHIQCSFGIIGSASHHPFEEPRMTESRRADDLTATTYEQMKRLAASYLQLESSTVTLSPTVLVHEAYLKLSKQDGDQYQSRGHFLALAATMMRRILVDHARSRKRLKRGGEFVRVLFDEDLKLSVSNEEDVLAIDELIEELQKLDERQARIVEMRFFGGMTVPEVAEVLGLSTRTIENEWRMCRAWLRKRLEG
ncbi:RNA polymerase sigma factor [Pirellula sp. SH-Sr6A]|nr:RNA polymerase sigma factor [Pirellula sp. SH-Sr6A]